MNATIQAAVFAGLLVIAVSPQALHASEPSLPTYHPQSVRVWFSPDGGCTEAIVAEMKAAKKSVRVQAYSFTSAPIAAAVVEAHRRGLDVQVLLDKSQRSEKYSSAEYLARAGVPVFVDDAHAIAHNKVIILDDAAVFTGSFNFSKAAEENNAENLLLIHDAELAARYLEDWAAHREHAEGYAGKRSQSGAVLIQP
jgi:phosphatidylserine/phosphatidylglycerophosphate/cardiolipin synthase-like enzyme